MKSPRLFSHSKQAFTLLEMALVILVLLAFIKIGLISSTKLNEWKLGKSATESLRAVYTAQRMFLADNPTTNVGTLTSALLIPYLPTPSGALPTVKSLTGTNLSFIVTVSPPIINSGTGASYDPSGSTTDSLWDLGK